MRIIVIFSVMFGFFSQSAYGFFDVECTKAVESKKAEAIIEKCSTSRDKEIQFVLGEMILENELGYYDNIGTGLYYIFKSVDQDYQPANTYLRDKLKIYRENKQQFKSSIKLSTTITREECEKYFSNEGLLRLDDKFKLYITPLVELCREAVQGDANSQQEIANFLAQTGQEEQAYSWFKLAASNGNEKSKFLLGLAHCSRQEAHGKKEVEVAREWFEKTKGKPYGELAKRQLDTQMENGRLLCEVFPSTKNMRENIGELAILEYFFRPELNILKVSEFVRDISGKVMTKELLENINKHLQSATKKANFRMIVTIAERFYKLGQHEIAASLMATSTKFDANLIDPKHTLFIHMAYRIPGTYLIKEGVDSNNADKVKKGMRLIYTAAILGDPKARKMLSAL